MQVDTIGLVSTREARHIRGPHKRECTLMFLQSVVMLFHRVHR